MEQESEATSPEFLLSTRCFSSNQAADFMSISEAIQVWTETLAVLHTILDCAGSGQGDFLFQYFALLQELAAAPAHVGVGTAYAWMCVCLLGSGGISIKDIAQAWWSLTDS